ncbi:MAG: iron ABC transporter substrate-binding protein [Actinomycetales bacterium]
MRPARPPVRSAAVRSAAVLAAVLGAAALGACGVVPGDRDVLTVYSGRTENLVGPLLEQYAETADIDIEVRYGQSAELALLLVEEGDRSPADVYLSQSPGPLGYLAGQDRLQDLPAEVLSLEGAGSRSTSGQWVGLSGRVRTVVYNTELVDPAQLPDSLLDLTAEEFRGRVAVAPTNGSFQDFVTAFRELEGEDAARDWLAGMAANEAPAYANNTAIVQAVARGEVDMGLVNHYYNYQQLEEDPDSPTANHFFADGDVGNLLLEAGACVLTTADDPDRAAGFVEFLLSGEAQEFFTADTFEYPLAAGVEPPAELPPLEGLGVATFDLDELGGGLARTEELIRESGLDTDG